MFRGSCLATLLVSAGCNCFQPVNPLADSGFVASDASLDAGRRCADVRDCPLTTAPCTFAQCLLGWCTTYVSGICDGGVPACTFASDCHGDAGSVPWCALPDSGAGFSCISGSCVWECPGGRACTANVDAGCLNCVVPLSGVCVGLDGGCANPGGTAIVESSTCANPIVAPPTPFTGTQLAFAPVGDCGSEVSVSGGAPIGQVVELSTTELIGDFPSMGGACTGQILPTNAQRFLLNCPSCQFVVRF